jgi:hypothetical protein
MSKNIINKFATIKIHKHKKIVFIDFKGEGTEQDIDDFYDKLLKIYHRKERKTQNFNLVVDTTNMISVAVCLKQMGVFIKFCYDKEGITEKLTEKMSVVVGENYWIITSTLEQMFALRQPKSETKFYTDIKDAFKCSTITKTKSDSKSDS